MKDEIINVYKDSIKEVLQITDGITSLKDDYLSNILHNSIEAFIPKISEKKKKLTIYQNKLEEIKSDETSVKIAIIGPFSAGKSSIINSLIGEELLPTSDKVTTSTIVKFEYGPKEKIYIESKDGKKQKIDIETFKKISDKNEKAEINGEQIKNIVFEKPLEKLIKMNIYDTPGFKTSEGGDDDVTLSAIKNVDVVLWIVDINSGGLHASDYKIVERIEKEKIFIINKADLEGEENGKIIKEEMEKALKEKGIRFKKILLYSAKEILKLSSDSDKKKLLEFDIKFNKEDLELNFFINKKNITDEKMNFIIRKDRETLKETEENKDRPKIMKLLKLICKILCKNSNFEKKEQQDEYLILDKPKKIKLILEQENGEKSAK